jgi:hypothetical protein
VETLLDQTYIFNAEDSKTNRCIELSVPRDFWGLELLCSYTPKKLQDRDEARRLVEAGLARYVPEKYLSQYGDWEQYLPVVSLITLSLDYEGVYLGCAHRHAQRQRHIISEEFSSPGFIRQAARSGAWRAVINVHAVVCRNTVYRLAVRGIERSEKNLVSV